MAEFSEVEKNQMSLPSLYETCFKVLSSEFGLIQKKYIKGLYICKMYVLDSPNCTARTSKLLLNFIIIIIIINTLFKTRKNHQYLQSYKKS